MKKSNLLLILVCLALLFVMAVPARAGVDLSRPGSFSKLAPEDRAFVYLSPGASLSWLPSMNAERYEICYLEELRNCSNWIDVGKVTHVTLGPGLKLHGWYFWNVRAVNAAGITYANGAYGEWLFKVGSAPGAFEKYEPVTGSQDLGTSLLFHATFSWWPRDHATAYNICIDTIDDDQCNTTWYLYNIWDMGGVYQAYATDLLPSTTYYWQVIAVDNDVIPASSTYADGPDGWWTFTTAAPPGAFHKLSPGQNATGFPTYALLSW
ncbi:hypothetical protein FDZ74_16515, partial [bacterium]